jgi:N-acetylmuramic acid 6-phosphate (MurNAc-6-P) etherase
MDKTRLFLILPAFVLFAGLSFAASSRRASLPAQEAEGSLLKLLGVEASPESVDYLVHKTQFQLHTLLTEQRHPKTWALSERIQASTETGLGMLLGVDEDIGVRLDALAQDPEVLVRLVAAVEATILGRKKIYVYGCGATGRLAKQIESSFWRPFWRRLKAQPDLWAKVKNRLGPDVEERLIGEMTGADRALISSLEGFEDLALIGRLQLQDRGIVPGDLVVCVTEGGETSSVIGTVLGALDRWKTAPGFSPAESRKRIYFVYNNPDDRLRPFERSRAVLDEPGITKINLTTGPQAITGSTRMQATTVETFVVGNAVEAAVERVLRGILNKKDMARLGFGEETSLESRLRAFLPILREVKRAVPALAQLTDMEAKAYAAGRFSTYFAGTGLITVFIDSTERSPTFRLAPLDTVQEPKRRSWIQVWTGAPDAKAAWRAFLGRPFRGLKAGLYQKPFAEEVEDPYLREKALASLAKAGDDQALLYDFSFAEPNLKKRGPKPGDVGVMALLADDIRSLSDPNAAPRRFERFVLESGAGLGVILVENQPGAAALDLVFGPAADSKKIPTVVIRLAVDAAGDPMSVRAHIALKMLLNAHSTAVMTKLGKVVGNTMTNVSPSNLKLVGRATYLIQLHVNDILARPEWVRSHGPRRPLSYAEANAVLFDAISFMRGRPEEVGRAAEVPLSIIRILESLRQKRGLTAEEALEIYKSRGLQPYLASFKEPIQRRP